MTALAVVPDVGAPDETWELDALFDWLDLAVPALVVAERRTDEARVHVGYVLWLLRGQARSADEYTRKVQALADTHEVTVRTLHRWREQAEFVHGLEPGRRSIAQRARRRSTAEPVEVVETPAHEQGRLFDPDNPEEIRELSSVVLEVGAARWADALTVAQVDSMIGVLRAARASLLRSKAPSGCAHKWKSVKSAALGTIWQCELCPAKSLDKERPLNA